MLYCNENNNNVESFHFNYVNNTINNNRYINFQYVYDDLTTGKKIDLDYSVKLISTPCKYGGDRWWFLCPLIVDGVECNRKVEKLYLPSNSMYFGCRHCHNLTYNSCLGDSEQIEFLVNNSELIPIFLQSKKKYEQIIGFWASLRYQEMQDDKFMQKIYTESINMKHHSDCNS